MKSVPRHIRPGVRANYITSSLYKHKGCHSVDKYNPHLYLGSLKANAKRAKPLFYEYKIHVKMPLSSSKQSESYELPKYETIKDNSTESFEKLLEQRGEKSTVCVGAELDFPEKSTSSILPSINKDKQRRRWNKLTKRTIFNFDLDASNNTVSLVREKEVGVEDDFDGRIRERVKAEGRNLSPHIQKKKGIEDRIHCESIRVYYELGSESPSKTLALTEAPVEKNERKLILKSKLMNNLKTKQKLRKILAQETSELTFDLNRLKLSKLNPSSLFRLYIAMKRAITPTFYATTNEELNRLDFDVMDILKHKPKSELLLTQYDNEVLEQYKSYMEQVENGDVMAAFWKVRKVKGHRPTCRESATLECIEDKFYLFGGYGVDRMNDLWCLSAENPDVKIYTWSLIRPLGTAIPERRYGHNMISYKNSIYVFGGSSDFIAGLKMRVVLDDMWKYSIEDNQWSKIDTSRFRFKSRMYAASCVFQGMWLIHGGTDGNTGSLLSSFVAYSLGIFI